MRKMRMRSHAWVIGLLTLVIGIGLSGGREQFAHATTITVNTASPFIVDDGLCSLFEAMINANDDLQTHADCPAGSGDDVIELASGEIYNITFPHSIGTGNCLPVITSTITIEGHSATIQRDGSSPTCRIFRVMENGGDLTLLDLIVRNGRQSGDAGGIFNTGVVRLFNSTLMDNSGSAGGMLNQGEAELTNSAVIGNIAEGVGGGGGIANNRGTLTLINSTVGNNFAALATAGGFGGGILNFEGTVTLINSTVSNNGSENPGRDIFNSPGGVVHMQNTILADDTFFRISTCSGILTSLGHNLMSDLRDCTVTLLDSDRIGAPKFNALVDDGTPGHAHFPLLSDSPAIDGGNDTVCPPTDQLGQSRIGICDIGAIEGGAIFITVVDVVGLSQADAEAAIIDAGLAVGIITTQHSNDVPAGDVISQNPNAGTEVPAGTAIDLVVSLGHSAECLLDVDMNGVVDVATDVVYIARHLLGLGPVPPGFRGIDPTIPPDDDIQAKVELIGPGLDVDMNGVVDVATDVVYIARHLLGLGPVPPGFRILEPSIPSDAEIWAKIDALCP